MMAPAASSAREARHGATPRRDPARAGHASEAPGSTTLARLAWGGGEALQRKCACGGTCAHCRAEEEEKGLAVQRQALPGATPLADATDATDAADGATPGPYGVLVDDGAPAAEGRMSVSAFLGTLEARLRKVCDAELAAAGRSTDGCPYLEAWLGFYRTRSAAQVERAIRRYTGAEGGNATALVEAIVSRVRAAVALWALTGHAPGLPEGVAHDGLPPAGAAVQARANGGGPASPASPGAVRARLGPGGELDAGVRARMESGFGVSFAGVRVHTDERAAWLATDLRALAFTVGQDVAFGAGQYDPGSPAGELLIAHELAHTIQQRGAGVDTFRQGAGGDHLLEEEAEQAAVGAVGRRFGLLSRIAAFRPAGLRLQRCQEVKKRCPKGYSWRVQSTAGLGSLGCLCNWKCMPGEPPRPAPPVSYPTIGCAPGINCSTGVKYEDVGSDYTKTGYGATFTPLGAEPWCGCFPLSIEGEQISGPSLQRTDFELTDVAGPLADIAAARRAGAPPKVDPTTGKIIPGEEAKAPGATTAKEPAAAVSGSLGVSVEAGLRKVADYRTAMDVGRGRNIAFADYAIEGKKGTKVGVSGKHARPGTVPVPAEPQFPSLVVGHDRSLDAEKKVLEALATEIGPNPNASGNIYLFSERPVCAGCDTVIGEFRKTYPKVNVFVVAGPPR